MKTLLALLLLAPAAHAGVYYDLTQHVSSATLRVGGVGVRCSTCTLQVNGGAAVTGTVEAVTLKGALDGGYLVAGTVDTAKLNATIQAQLAAAGTDSSRVLKAGDTMTGALARTIANGENGIYATSNSGIGADASNGLKVKMGHTGAKSILVRDAADSADILTMTESSGLYTTKDIQTGGAFTSAGVATFNGGIAGKAGTLTSRLTAPDATLTYGLTAATASFSSDISIGGAPPVAGYGLASYKSLLLYSTANELRFAGAQDALIGHTGAFRTTLQTNGVVRQIIDVGGGVSMPFGLTASSVTATGGATGTALQVRGAFKQWAQNTLDSAGTWSLTPCHSIFGDSSLDYCIYDGTGITAERFYQGASGRVSLHGTTFNALASGSVGIGTASPATKLHMSSGTLTIDGTGSSIDLMVPGFSNTVNTNLFQTIRHTVGLEQFGWRLDNSYGNLHLDNVNNYTPMTWAVGSGNVGINLGSVTPPATTLDVNGNAQFGSGATKSTFTATGVLTLNGGMSVGVAGLPIIDASSTDLYLRVNGDSTHDLIFAPANTSETVRFKGNGSVGVGTGSPATTLDVNGNAQFGSGATKSTFTATGALQVGGTGSSTFYGSTMTIAATGAVSAPSQPGARTRQLDSVVLPTATYAKMYFGSNCGAASGCYANGGVWGGSSSSGTFTANGSGIYFLSCDLVLSGHSAATLVTISIADDLANTNQYAVTQMTPASTNTTVIGARNFAYLANGQAVQCNIRADSAGVTANGATSAAMVAQKVW